MGQVKALFRAGLAVWFTVFQLLAGVPGAAAQSGVENGVDFDPPLIEHELIGEVESDVRQTFVATVVDDDELASVTLFYRFSGEYAYSTIMMQRVSFSSTYIAHVQTSPSSSANIEYYIQASDRSGNRTVRGYAFNPLLRSIQVDDPMTASAAIEYAEEQKEANKVAASSSPARTAIYVVLGVLALGLVASAAGGGSDPGPSTGCVDGSCQITITVGQP